MVEQGVTAQSVQFTQELAHRQLLSPLAIQLLSTLSLTQAEVDAVVAARFGRESASGRRTAATLPVVRVDAPGRPMPTVCRASRARAGSRSRWWTSARN